MDFLDQIARVDRAVQDRLGGVTVVFRPDHEDSIEIVGMFDEQYLLAEEGHPGVESVAPVLFVRLEDLLVELDDDEPTVEIDEKTYRVVERKPDGVGGVRLRLHRVGV